MRFADSCEIVEIDVEYGDAGTPDAAKIKCLGHTCFREGSLRQSCQFVAIGGGAEGDGVFWILRNIPANSNVALKGAVVVKLRPGIQSEYVVLSITVFVLPGQVADRGRDR